MSGVGRYAQNKIRRAEDGKNPHLLGLGQGPSYRRELGDGRLQPRLQRGVRGSGGSRLAGLRFLGAAEHMRVEERDIVHHRQNMSMLRSEKVQ